MAAEVAQELDERWEADFLKLAHGKRMLSEFVEFTGFRGLRDFLSALTQTAHDNPTLLPPEFERLRERMRALLPAAATDQ